MIYIAITIVLFVIELFVKNYIVKNKNEGDKECIVEDELYIQYTKNKGAIYSTFEDKSKIVCGISSVLVVIVGIIYGFTLSKRGKFLSKLGLSMLMAGGLSNVYDRIKRKYVVDYLYWKRIKKIIFNMADAFIFIGSIIYLIGEILRKE